MRCFLGTLVLAASVTFAFAGTAAAQDHVSLRGTHRNLLGFSYGWKGGISVTADGAVRMLEHPRVSMVRDGSSAEAAGLAEDDVLVSVNGRDTRDPAVLRDVEPATRLFIVVRRDDGELRVVLTTASAEVET